MSLTASAAPESLAFRLSSSSLRRAWESDVVRRVFLLLALAGIWQAYAIWLDRPFILPTLLETIRALIDGLIHGPLISRTISSLRVLMIGYVIGVAAAGVLTVAAATTRLGRDLLEVLCAMLNPLPAMALLPLTLLWLGVGTPSIVLVVIHSVLWPVATNANNGVSGVSPTLRLVGRNLGLTPLQFVRHVLLPGALPSTLGGLRLGWAFAWRTLIASELVFGVSAGSGGLGWFIYESKNRLDVPSVFAGLLLVMAIGLAVEYGVFRTIERRTVRRWGMVQ